jgi:hypothetical protein
MIEDSLELLKADHLHLRPLHNIGIPEEADAVFAIGGAMQALVECTTKRSPATLVLPSTTTQNP